MTKRKTSPYYKAAILIAEGKDRYSCHAILTVCFYSGASTLKDRDKYVDFFFHDKQEEFFGWWASLDFSKENQLCRSLALLFMHEMCVRGEL